MQRLRFEKDQRQFLLAKALTRSVLAYYARIAPRQVVFEHNTFGKPSLRAACGVSFNLSHSGKLSVLAVGESLELGVDIESVSAKRAGAHIAARYFSAPERRFLQGLPPDRRDDAFFALWTLKEAFVKANGQGLSLPLSDFAFSIEGQALRLAVSHDMRLSRDYWSYALARIDCFSCAYVAGAANPGAVTGRFFRVVPGERCDPMEAPILANGHEVRQAEDLK